MTTLDIEIAIMQLIGVRQNVIVNGIHWGLDVGSKLMHECDILSLSKSSYASEVEIKISKPDLLKDKLKLHGHCHNHIKYLWFAVPVELRNIALIEIPYRAGLYLVYDDKTVSICRPAIANKNAVKWTDKERNYLMKLGTMRIITLKEQLQRTINTN